MAPLWLLLLAAAAGAAEKTAAPSARPSLEALPRAAVAAPGGTGAAPASASAETASATSFDVSAAAAAAAAPAGGAVTRAAPGARALAAAERIAAVLSGHVAAEDGVAPQAAPLADLLDIELPFLAEASRRLALDAEGAIVLDRHGFPDRESYFAAAKAAALLRDAGLAARLGAGPRAALERLAHAYRRTRALLFSGGNELAVTTDYEEPTPGGRRLSILDFVRTERFKTPGRWVWSSQRTREAPAGFARVTADRARSPFLKELGAGAFTTIYWAAVPGDDFGRPALDGMRVRVNSDAFGNELTLEVIAPIGREDDGAPRWKGFFFRKIGDEWVPGSPRKAEPSVRCIACHVRVDAQGRRRLTPVPTILKTKGDFLAVGYEDTPLLARYLARLAAP